MTGKQNENPATGEPEELDQTELERHPTHCEAKETNFSQFTSADK